MHKFLRTIGFSTYQKKKDVEHLIEHVLMNPSNISQIQIDEDTNLCEIRTEFIPGMGLAAAGTLDENGRFCLEYYYPYIISRHESSNSECSIQRHAEKETCAGLLDEYKVGISLIFYLNNCMEYRQRRINKEPVRVVSINLSGLSVRGKILFPVQKTEKQREKAKVASKDRNSLIEAAKNGDEDAIETLTIEDIDMYSQISRRIMKEDIYSIIDSCFMPCGVECDQYAVIGEITHMELYKNSLTGEEVYDFALECNDIAFHVGILKADLIGEPEVGRRFKGQIWMQGKANFINIAR